MIQPLLSIQIPLTSDRKTIVQEVLYKLGFSLGMYYMQTEGEWISRMSSSDGEIEVLIYNDERGMSIGEKREKLYVMAYGKYSWQIDSDDLISDNAIELILNAIKSNPGVDCVTFEEHIDIDGKIEKSNHSLAYGDWEGEGGKELWDGFNYHRTPFFKSVIKTEIAKSVPIPHIRFSEDHRWAQALKPYLKTEIHIPEQIYKYIHRSTNFNERYGFDKQ